MFSVQSPPPAPPPGLCTCVLDGCLDPLPILMKLVAAEAGNVDGSAAVKFQQAVRSLVSTAQKPPDASTSFWRGYARLERTYNAVKTMCLCVLVLLTVPTTASRSGKKAKVKKKATSLPSQPNDMTEQLKSLTEFHISSSQSHGFLDELIPVWTHGQFRLTEKEKDIEAMKNRMCSAPTSEILLSCVSPTVSPRNSVYNKPPHSSPCSSDQMKQRRFSTTLDLFISVKQQHFCLPPFAIQSFDVMQHPELRYYFNSFIFFVIFISLFFSI